ncbi:MAG: hypothetical protein V1882_07605, partial [Candidatus Omnitrophota bacterium]
MKTLKEVQCQKRVVWSLVVMFSFLQIVPTGWAATRPVAVDELQLRSVPGSVDALANSPASPKPAPQQAIGFVDSTAFQLNDNPLSPATGAVTSTLAAVKNPIEKVIIGPSRGPIEKVVVGPTIEPVHIGPSPVTNPIEKVIVGPSPVTNPIEKVVVGPSPVTNPIEKVIVGPSPVTNPIEKVIVGPSPVTNPIEKVVIGPSSVVPPAVQTHVDELKEALGERFLVNAQLQADGSYLVTVKFLVTISDENGLSETLSGRSGLTEMKYNLSWDGILNKDSLRMTFWLDEAGKVFHPKEELLFNGMALLKGGMNDTETLAFLAREITVMKVAADGAVTIRVPGRMYFKVYRDEEGALQVEMYVQLPPAVQAYADKLKSTLGAGYDVTAMLRSDGTFLVRIERSNTCSGTGDVGCSDQNAGPQGSFRSMKFSISKDGSVNWDSIKAYYNGMEVDGKMLFGAMGALEASFHPVGSAWMPPSQTYIARLVELASQIRVKESGENFLRFDHDGKSYKASRDANGNIKLDNWLPPAVQAYVDALKKSLGDRYVVDTILQADGTYLVKMARVTRIPGPITGSYIDIVYPNRPGDFLNLQFKLTQDGSLDRSSITAFYGAIYTLDAELLFEGMKLLKPGVNDQDAMRLMTQISLNSELYTPTIPVAGEIGAIHFLYMEITPLPKNYRVYRDEQGNIKLKEELPPSVQWHVADLQKRIGAGFKVMVTGQPGGTYLVSVTDSKNYITGPTSGLKEMSYLLRPMQNGWIDPTTLHVTYYGNSKVDTQLLLQAAELLTKPLVMGMDSVALLAKIAVISTDQAGAIYFSVGNKNYKAFRDANGNVKLLDEAVATSIVRPVAKTAVKTGGLKAEVVEKTKAGTVALGVLKSQFVSSRKVSAKVQVPGAESSTKQVSTGLKAVNSQGSKASVSSGSEKGSVLLSKVLAEVT